MDVGKFLQDEEKPEENRWTALAKVFGCPSFLFQLVAA